MTAQRVTTTDGRRPTLAAECRRIAAAYATAEPGCYGDGARGIHQTEHILEDLWGVSCPRDSEAADWLQEAVEEEVNANLSGMSFGWHDGDYMLWTEADWQDMP